MPAALVNSPPTIRLFSNKTSAFTRPFSAPLPAPLEPTPDQLLPFQRAMKSAVAWFAALVKEPPTYRSPFQTIKASAELFKAPSPAPFDPRADHVAAATRASEVAVPARAKRGASPATMSLVSFQPLRSTLAVRLWAA